MQTQNGATAALTSPWQPPMPVTTSGASLSTQNIFMWEHSYLEIPTLLTAVPGMAKKSGHQSLHIPSILVSGGVLKQSLNDLRSYIPLHS